MNLLIRIFCFLLLLAAACRGPGSGRGKVIVVQPFDDFSPEKARLVYTAIKRVVPNTILRAKLPIPSKAWYPARERYRADSLIHYLERLGGDDTVLIGLTNKDISTTKGRIQDWGIMGLGDRPGNACVVSTYRLAPKNKDDQLYKVAVHELGHTQGLLHCGDTTCFMRDAEGGNTFDAEKGFCPDCKRFLRNKGWRL